MSGQKSWGLLIAGTAAGAINGLFGAGGGMVLVPLLSIFFKGKEADIFPASVSIIFPISVVSVLFAVFTDPVDWHLAFPYLIGSALGGIICGIWGRKIPVRWLHRGLGIMIIMGGIRYLC